MSTAGLPADKTGAVLYAAPVVLGSCGCFAATSADDDPGGNAQRDDQNEDIGDDGQQRQARCVFIPFPAADGFVRPFSRSASSRWVMPLALRSTAIKAPMDTRRALCVASTCDMSEKSTKLI